MSSSGLTKWLTDNVVGLLILVVGITVMARAHSKDHKGAIVTVGIVLIGLSVLGLATGNRATSVGNFLAGLIYGIDRVESPPPGSR